jgi:hypothetical protein
MGGSFAVFGDVPEPPPMLWLTVLASVPAGSSLRLTLPDGSAIAWVRP